MNEEDDEIPTKGMEVSGGFYSVGELEAERRNLRKDEIDNRNFFLGAI